MDPIGTGVQDPAEAWLDAFFDAYYEHRPVNATFIGVHDHDGRLPDLSQSGLGDQQAWTREHLARCEALPEPRELDGAREHLGLDVKLARGFLRIQDWELGSSHGPLGNPSLHTGEAIFGLMSLFLTDFAPLAVRAESATARMTDVPRFLSQARDLVRAAPPQWTARAIRECDGALAFLTEGIHAVQGVGAPGLARMIKAAAGASGAFAEHRAHLEQMQAAPTSLVACGEEAFGLLLREGHFLKLSANEIAEWAREELATAAGQLEARAADFGTEMPEEALALLSEIHPAPDGYYQRYADLWTESRALALRHDLVTWPEFPIRYVARPEWSRAAAPHLYFLFYRSPAAFNRPAVHDYLVTPIEPDLEPAELYRLLRANNDSVIKLNHVLHHGGIGHHVQNWHAFRSASRVGQVAAVDCAARIAMFCGGTMAEGWACYATDLMREFGMLTQLEEYAELRSRTRMCARAIVDVELHRGAFTLNDAADFYEREAGMSTGGARGEAIKNSMFPGAAVMYLAGTDILHALRRDLTARDGPRFSLKGFHDAVLAYGSVPVALVAEAMRGTPQRAGKRSAE